MEVKKKASTGKHIALEKSKQKNFNKNIKKLKKDLEALDNTLIGEQKVIDQKDFGKQRGIVYLGHIPKGFHLNEMRKYFEQFGKVCRIRLMRSPKTGRSKGYAFVEFQHAEVAKIAAETMNNYLMFKRRIVAEYIPPEKTPKHLFKPMTATTATKFHHKESVKEHRTIKHAVRTPEKHEKKVLKRLRKLKEKGMLDCCQINHVNFPVEAVHKESLEISRKKVKTEKLSPKRVKTEKSPKKVKSEKK